MSSYGIDLKADLIARLDAHRKSCILRIDNVEIYSILLDNINNAEFVVSVLYNTCIEYLSAACSVERCGLENDELAVLIVVSDIQHF